MKKSFDNKENLLDAVKYTCNEDEGSGDSGPCSNSGNGCTGSCNHSSK